jgi:hypothetical protein
MFSNAGDAGLSAAFGRLMARSAVTGVSSRCLGVSVIP